MHTDYSRSTAIAICQLLELLKVVEITFERHSLRILDLISHITQHIAFAIITVIEKSRVRNFAACRCSPSHLFNAVHHITGTHVFAEVDSSG